MSTLHAALAELADEWERDWRDWDCLSTNTGQAARMGAAKRIRNLLAAHPAPATASEAHVVHVTAQPIAEDAVWCDECEEWVCHGDAASGHCEWQGGAATGVTSSDGDRGLSEEEFNAHGDLAGRMPWDQKVFTEVDVLAILAARLAAVAQPAGETRVEVMWMSDDRKSFASERHVKENGPKLPSGAALRRYERTVTSFPDVVGEWTEVVGDE